MELSIVIPAYNESKKIKKDIFAADKFIQDNFDSGQIIVVDDGSEDETTEVAQSIRNEIKTELEIIKLDKNSGKGSAIANGVENSRLSTVGYGESQPVADNATKEGRYENRRIELTLQK